MFWDSETNWKPKIWDGHHNKLPKPPSLTSWLSRLEKVCNPVNDSESSAPAQSVKMPVRQAHAVWLPCGLKDLLAFSLASTC